MGSPILLLKATAPHLGQNRSPWRRDVTMSNYQVGLILHRDGRRAYSRCPGLEFTRWVQSDSFAYFGASLNYKIYKSIPQIIPHCLRVVSLYRNPGLVLDFIITSSVVAWLSISWLSFRALGDSMVLRHINPDSVGLIILDGLSLSIVLMLSLHHSLVFGNIIRVVDGDGVVLGLDLGLSHIICLGFDIDFSLRVGQWVTLSGNLGFIDSFSLGEVHILGLIAILSDLMIVMRGLMLSIINHLGAGSDCWFSICCHGRIHNLS